MAEAMGSCTECEGTGRLRTSGWDGEGFPCPMCSTARTVVRLIVTPTGEAKEWATAGTDNGEPGEQTALQVALQIVPDLEAYIDMARMKGCDVEIGIRWSK